MRSRTISNPISLQKHIIIGYSKDIIPLISALHQQEAVRIIREELTRHDSSLIRAEQVPWHSGPRLDDVRWHDGRYRPPSDEVPQC